jgi:putative membrane protein
MDNNRVFFSFLLLSLSGILIWSFTDPRNYFIWKLDAAPAIIGLMLLLFTYRYFPFTRLAYILMWMFAVILLVGAHYTYPEVPLFNWLRDTLELNRNHYDRLVHLGQGFTPAIGAREVLLRKTPLLPGKMLFSLVVAVCLAASAFLEIIEWWVALLTGLESHLFLGTQGDNWDTQWDMFLCFVGSVFSQLLLAKMHNRQLRQLNESNLNPKLRESF